MHAKSSSLRLSFSRYSEIRRVGSDDILAVRSAPFVASTVAKIKSPKDRPYRSPRSNFASDTTPTCVKGTTSDSSGLLPMATRNPAISDSLS